MTDTPTGHVVNYPYMPHLTAMCVKYKNPDGSLIADQLMPYVKVNSKDYTYNLFPMKTFFSAPEDIEVGRYSETPNIFFDAKQESASLKSYAVQHPMSRTDDWAPPAFDVAGKAVELLNNVLDLRHELEISKLMRDPDNYEADNKVVVTGATDKWNHPDAKPYDMLEAILKDALVPFNVMTMPVEAWYQFSKHPNVIKAMLGDANTNGRVMLEDVRQRLGLEKILIGKARINVAEPGASPQLVRAWTNDVILTYVNKLATTVEDFSFGLTAQFDNRLLKVYFDHNMGPQGSDIIRVTHRKNPHVMSKHAGYLIKDVVEG